MIKFSIIVPVYNVENYLRKCLDSIVNQTCQNYEVIIICDKCSDNSEVIVENMLKNIKILVKFLLKKQDSVKHEILVLRLQKENIFCS